MHHQSYWGNINYIKYKEIKLNIHNGKCYIGCKFDLLRLATCLNAVSEECEDVNTHNIYINQNHP